MIRALFSAASGMTAQQMNVDNIANNLANANTAGYKARRVQFQDLLYQNVMQPGASASAQTVLPAGLQLGTGHAAVFATRSSSPKAAFRRPTTRSTWSSRAAASFRYCSHRAKWPIPATESFSSTGTATL